tara:strand:+ start:180 stop:851 length:672 start_codon:yes stop_codon:yes gene_type:complete
MDENNKNIKEAFIQVADAAQMIRFQSIADVGCAAGAFPNYLKKRFPEAQVTGIEYLNNLLKKASEDFPEITFIKGNVLDNNSICNKYDVITMLGVFCIFDDYSRVLKNVLSWLNPNGRLILHNMVSDYEIDVFIKYAPSNVEFCEDKLQSGWNIISKRSLALAAEENNARIIFSKDFKLQLNLEKKNDLLRSWTEKNIYGEKDIFNALHIRQPQKIVVIQKND